MNLIGILIALVVIGVLVWAARRFLALIPMDGWIKQVVDTVLIVVVVLAVVFYIVIPLLSSVAGMLHMPSFH
jgi:hypothetical protein